MNNENNNQLNLQDTNNQSAVIQQLVQQNQLLLQQNRLLQELVNKTPDKADMQAGFNEQQKYLYSIVKNQNQERIWNIIKLVLIILAAILVFYGLYRIWSYFDVLNDMLSKYADMLSQYVDMLSEYAQRFSSSFGGIEETLQQIEEFFKKITDFLRIG